MPTVYHRVDAPGVNILQIVIEETINGLLTELELTDTFTNSVYVKSPFQVNSDYSDGLGTLTLVKNRCDVEASFILDKAQVPWPNETPYTSSAYGVRTQAAGHYTPILVDAENNILIEHQTVACAITLNTSMTFTTFDLATQAFDTLMSRYHSGLSQTVPFDLQFSYPVSMSVLQFITSVYKASNSQTQMSFGDYLQKVAKGTMSFDVRKSQILEPTADTQLMVRCQQLRCQAQMNFEQKEPEVNLRDKLPEYYTVNFELTIQFGRPTTIMIHTPVSVNNVVLEPLLFSSINKVSHSVPGLPAGFQDLIFNSAIKTDYGNYLNAHQITRMPVYDDWFSVDDQYRYYQYRPFLIAHFTLDGETTQIDLKNLGDIQLHPVVLAILKETGNIVFGYGGLFTLGVYANDLRLGSQLVSLSDDLILTIRSGRPDKVYHLILSETTNLQKTSPEWDELLIKYRYFFPLTIERNLQHLITNKSWMITTGPQFIRNVSLWAQSGQLRSCLVAIISAQDADQTLWQYTTSVSQLLNYLLCTPSLRTDYTVPTGTDSTSVLIQTFYSQYASVTSRSLFIAFLEQCLVQGLLTLDQLPDQYLTYSRHVYPHAPQGSYYGFNAPLRVIQFDINTITTNPSKSK